MTSPCFNCPDRTSMCHATCKRPADFEAWRKAQRTERLLDIKTKEITFDGIRKAEARRNGR